MRALPQLFAAWIVGLLLMYYSMPILVLIVVGMAPTWIFWVAEPSRVLLGTLSVGSLNFVGVLPYLVDLVERGQDPRTIEHTLTSPRAYLMMVGSAAMGILLYYWIPEVIATTLRFRARLQVDGIKKVQEKLIEEWGKDVDPSGKDV